LLERTRVTLAPLRFGAGLKGKVASSIAVGVPCIGTDIAFEGMAERGLETIKFAANTSDEFADLAERLYNEKHVWDEASEAGVIYHNENYAHNNVAEAFVAMLDKIAS